MSDEQPASQTTTEAGAPPAAAVSVRPRSLKISVLYTLIGTVIFNAGRFAAAVFIAKFSTAALLGAFEYATSLSTLIALFFTSSMRAVFVSDPDTSFGNFQALRNITTIASVAILAGAIATKGYFDAADGQFSRSFIAILVLVSLGKVLYHQSEIVWGVYQKRERLDLLMWTNTLRGLGMIAAFAILTPTAWWLVQRGKLPPNGLELGAELACVVYLLVWAAVWLFYDRPKVQRRADVDHAWDWTSVRRLGLQMLPLSIAIGLLNLCEFIPKAFIEDQSKSSLGYFAAINYVTVAGMLLITQTGVAASNRLATYYRENLRAFVVLLLKLVGMALVLGLSILGIVLLLGRNLLVILYKPEYADYFPDFLVLVCALTPIMLCGVFGLALTLMRIFWVQVGIQAVVLAITTIAAWNLIPADPVRGGAQTMFLRYGSQASIYAIVLTLAIVWRWKHFYRAAAPPGKAG